MTATTTRDQLKEAIERLTGERHCGNCQRYVALEKGGAWQPTRQAKRWVCGPCMERKRTRKPSK
jgi:hypothetical protein